MDFPGYTCRVGCDMGPCQPSLCKPHLEIIASSVFLFFTLHSLSTVLFKWVWIQLRLLSGKGSGHKTNKTVLKIAEDLKSLLF